MQIINNTNGLFENIYFKDTTIDQSIKNHKELLEIIIPQCSKLLVASPFLMDNFKYFFKDINIQNIDFELITTCRPQGNEQIVKPFQIKNFGEAIQEFTTRWPNIHLINSLHSKIYLFYKDNSIVLGIVTSANFTNNGLSKNHETGVVLSDNKILESLELDIKKNLNYVNLSESQIDDLCIVAETIKKDKPQKKQEDITIDLSKYFDKNDTKSIDSSLNNNKAFFDENQKFDFENFISEQILNNDKVESIDLSNQNLNTIPTNINKLTELKHINISNNNITVLPDELFSLNKLETLNFSNNNIKTIPDSIRDMARTNPKVFNKLVIYGNKDIKIHEKITWIKSFDTIIVDKSIINRTLMIFNHFKDTNVQIIDNHNNDLYEYLEYCNNKVLNDKTNILEYEYSKNIIKTCTMCYKELELDKFYNSEKHSGKNNYYPHCKDCNSKDNLDKEKQPDYIIRRMYNQKIMPRADKNNASIPYTKEEFVELLEEQPLFKELYEKYKKSEYITERKPSFYLIDKQTDFSLENIQICTSKEANEKYRQSLMNYGGKTTIQFSLAKEPINIFKSTQEASRQTGVADSGICDCANGKVQQAKGYKWEYLENINHNITLKKIDKIKKINQCYVDDEGFLFELVDNKDLENYLKIILYFKNYEDQEIKELIKDTLLSNTQGYLLEIFEKDYSEFVKMFISNYSKIEVEHFDYLYGFVNIRYDENENIPISKILKIIASNTMSEQLIEFLMEYKANQEILIAIIENDRKRKNNQYLVSLEVLRRILEYAISSNDISLAKKIISRKEITRELILDRTMSKFDNEVLKDILLNTNYLDSRVNRRINNKFGNAKNKK